MAQIGMDEVYSCFAHCPTCSEDWSLGYTKTGLLRFANIHKSDEFRCCKCKRVYPFDILKSQLI